MPGTLTIRPPRGADAEAIADQSTQLGYPASAAEVRDRLALVEESDDAAVLVAVEADDRVIGWVHVGLKREIVAPLTAQIKALIVDEAARSRGVGRELLGAAEAWARGRGCHQVVVGTRVTRERAHRFYTREGYTLQKTSYFFEKPI